VCEAPWWCRASPEHDAGPCCRSRATYSISTRNSTSGDGNPRSRSTAPDCHAICCHPAGNNERALSTRLPKCSSESFAQKVEEAVPAEIREALLPLVPMAAALSDCIQGYDEKIEKLGREKYGHTALLRQVKGVGPITALAYVLTLENPERFATSRDVGPYLGLVPMQEDSGDSQPQLGISKTGDTMLRKLLVGSAHYILGPFGPDTDLRRYGLRLCERGGKNAKKRAG